MAYHVLETGDEEFLDECDKEIRFMTRRVECYNK